MLLLLFVSFLISAITTLFIIRYSHLYMLDRIDGGPQRFHTHPVPRIGGVAIMIAILASLIAYPFTGLSAFKEYLLILTCSIPAFSGGLVEDITQKVGVTKRLLLTMGAAGLGFFLLDAGVTRVSIPLIDDWFRFIPFSLFFTMIAVGGVANAINIIDGFNGLASMVSIFILAALAYISYIVGDTFLLYLSLSLMGAILGFFIWNYPNGLIFLGDGGAYFIGFMIADVSILLVNRHPKVSPWFPMLLVIYPVWETLFSIYRKKVLRGQSPGMPDGLHFHMMIYKRLLGWVIGSKKAEHLIKRNAMTSIYLWGISLMTVIPALFFWQNTSVLMGFVILFVILYVWLYWRIVKFKTPKWLVFRKKLRN